MKIPILDLKAQYRTIKPEVDRAIQKIVEAQDFVLGEDLRELEKEIAMYCGARYGTGVGSGTDALILSLMALGIGPGDEVITTPFTFFATAEAVSLVGAKPVFVDIDKRTYNIDPSLIERAITLRTKAVIPVHLYGQCADMDPILEIAGRRGIKVIEDCAQAIGATYKGRKAGSMGDLGAISFYPGKNLGAYGEGGMIVTGNAELAERVKVLRVHGSSERYVHSVIGTNSRLDNLQAAVLRVKFAHLDAWLDARREKARYYDTHLAGLPLDIPYRPSCNVHTYHLYVIHLHEKADLFMKHLIGHEIETRAYYPVALHLQKCYENLGYKAGDLPQAEAAARSTCAIAVYPELEERELEYVVSVIKKFFAGA